MGVSSGLNIEMVWTSHQTKAEGVTEEEIAKKKIKNNRLRSGAPLHVLYFVFIGSGNNLHVM